MYSFTAGATVVGFAGAKRLSICLKWTHSHAQTTSVHMVFRTIFPENPAGGARSPNTEQTRGNQFVTIDLPVFVYCQRNAIDKKRRLYADLAALTASHCATICRKCTHLSVLPTRPSNGIRPPHSCRHRHRQECSVCAIGTRRHRFADDADAIIRKTQKFDLPSHQIQFGTTLCL